MIRKLLLILVSLLPVLASAYDAEVDGIYYNISEDGATVTYRDDDFNSYSGSVVIPPSINHGGKTYPVTSIGEGAFFICNKLTSVSIPGSVTSIREEAFSGCRSLTSITIPEGMISICNGAFF
ncbi:MAG: leucine-rich repeat protein [Bacteroidaceae bacterium]|nr:leucine-rich repeat protein [Bacteroidaceae bacterium]